MYDPKLTKPPQDFSKNIPKAPRQPQGDDIDDFLGRYTKKRVREEALKQGVDPDLAERQFGQESAYRPDVITGQKRSSAGAIGPGQLMPGTAKELGVDPYHVDQNIEGSVRYMKQQLDAFGGDTRKALAAYNAGPGAVKKYGGIPPYKETQDYVNKIAGDQAQDDIDEFLSRYKEPRSTAPAKSQPQPKPKAPTPVNPALDFRRGPMAHEDAAAITRKVTGEQEPLKEFPKVKFQFDPTHVDRVKNNRPQGIEEWVNVLNQRDKEREKQQRLAVEAEAQRAPKSTLGRAGTSLVRGVIEGSTAPIRLAAEMDRRPGLQQTMQGIQGNIAEWESQNLPLDRRTPVTLNPLKGEFYTGENLGRVASESVPYAVGAALPTMALGRGAGLVGRAGGLLGRFAASPANAALLSRAVTGGYGAIQGAEQGYARARAAGMSDEQARKASLVDALIGSAESLGSAGTTGGVVHGGLRGIGHEIRQEGLQEALSSAASDLNAKYFSGYEPNKPLADIAGESLGAGAVGAVTGGIMAAPGAMLNRKAPLASPAPIAGPLPGVRPTVAPGTQTQVTPLGRPVAPSVSPQPLEGRLPSAQPNNTPNAAPQQADGVSRLLELLQATEGAPTPATPRATPRSAAPVAALEDLRTQAEGFKQDAMEAERAGNFEAAATAYESARDMLRMANTRHGKTADATTLAELRHDINLQNRNLQLAKQRMRDMAKQANRPTAELPAQRAPRQQPQAPMPADAPLLRPDAVVNPEGGIPAQPPTETPTESLQRQIDQQAASRPAAPAKRIASRVAELGGVDARHAGEMQDVADARRVGVIRRRADMSPDILARQLQSEGYDVDPENLDTLWEALRRDIANEGGERPVNTAELRRRGEGTAELDRRMSAQAQQMQPAPEVNLSQPEQRRTSDLSVPSEFTPDPEDLAEVRAFGRRERTGPLAEELPTGQLRTEGLRRPAPMQPAQPSPVERRRAVREAALPGNFGKFAEQAHKRGGRVAALAEHPQLRELLNLPQMPAYRFEDGGLNPAWREAAQDTLNAMAALAGKDRSSEINYLPGERTPQGKASRGEMGDVYKAIEGLAKAKGQQIDPSLRQAFVDTVTASRAFQSGFEGFNVDARVEDIRQSLQNEYREGRKPNEKAAREQFATIAAEYGLSPSRANALWAGTKATAKKNADRLRGQTSASATPAGRVAKRRGNDVASRNTATEAGGRAAVQSAIQELKPRGGLAPMGDLKAKLGRDADAQILAAAERGEIALQRHNQPSAMTDAEKANAVHDAAQGDRGWYIGASVREGSPIKAEMRGTEALGFYSQLQRVIDQKMPARASAAQVRAIIENPQSGVKPDEIKWTGLDDYLRGKDTVTKADVQEFLQANDVRVEEVESEKKAYKQYTLPGGENYRELLLTMPSKAVTKEQYARDATGRDYADLSPVRQEEIDESYNAFVRDQTGRDRGNYKSSHFDEPNILAHIRFNERTDADGKKVLHIEEIQSDWGQDLRKQRGKISQYIDNNFEQLVRQMEQSKELRIEC